MTPSSGAGGHAPGDVLRDELAVVLRVAVLDLERLGPLEVEVQVVLPGEADAAVHLDRLAADLARGIADVGLGDGGGDGRVLRARVERPRRVVDGGVRVLDLQQHLGALVADGLEGADGWPNCSRTFAYPTAMSRQRRAAPSISAAAPTAARRSIDSRSAWRRLAGRASGVGATGTPSRRSSDQRVARSMPVTGSACDPPPPGPRGRA